MSAVAIATLIEALLPSLLGLYSEIEQQYAGQVKPLADILAEANANWDAIAAKAAAQAPPTPAIVSVS